MGIFDGYLLVSDIDGTFEHEKTHPAPENNVAAIRYFTEQGGLFTFATGRLSGHMHMRGFDTLVNAPVCLCNGSIIYDAHSRTVLDKKLLTRTAGQIAADIAALPVGVVRYVAPLDDEQKPLSLDIGSIPHSLKDKYPAKAIAVLENESDANVLETALKADSRYSDCYICKSWEVGVEILPKGGTKGEALDYIKAYTGAHTAIGIGDYGNDLPLIEHADIGVAVGNATDELKAIADMVVCDCKDGAIADLVERLKRGM